jgi:hypothetical protein
MDHWADDPARTEFDPLNGLVALWTASNPEELWRALVLQPGESSTDDWEAVDLLRRHHGDGTLGALRTALLLCTDRRWDRCTHRLIAGIVATSILGKDDLDELAACFLWSDRYRFEYPVGWIGTEWVGVDVDGGGAVSPRVMHLDPSTPVPVDRTIRPVGVGNPDSRLGRTVGCADVVPPVPRGPGARPPPRHQWPGPWL